VTERAAFRASPSFIVPMLATAVAALLADAAEFVAEVK
jgi:hypothetical protein